MSVEKYDVFDKTKVFKKECQPILDELILKCSLHRIPFFWSACTKSNEDESIYTNDAVATGSRDIRLKDDRIAKFLAVLGGFDVVPSRKTLEIDMDAIEAISEGFSSLGDDDEE